MSTGEEIRRLRIPVALLVLSCRPGATAIPQRFVQPLPLPQVSFPAANSQQAQEQAHPETPSAAATSPDASIAKDSKPVSASPLAHLAGAWIVDQPFHAAYEATCYLLRPDGSMQVGKTMGRLTNGRRQVGTVVKQSPSHSCEFGDRWSVEDPNVLVFTADCSDGRKRDIRFSVRQDAKGNASAELVSVGGQRDWRHDGREWLVWKCLESARGGTRHGPCSLCDQ